MMDYELLIDTINKYVNSPKFQNLPEYQKQSFIKHGIPMCVSVFLASGLSRYLFDTSEIERSAKELDVAALERLWGV